MDLLLIGATALLAVVDLALWRGDSVVDTGRISTSIAFLVPCLGAIATVAVAVRRHRPALVVGLVAGLGIALTTATWIIGTGLPPSFAALFALALLTTQVLRSEPGGTAMLLTVLAAIAVAAESVRPMVSSAAYLLVLCEGAFAFAVGAGVYLRWSDWRRVVAEEAARTDERLEIARELHDMVGHYVSGIVVQAQAARHVAERQPAAAAAALQSIEVAGSDAMLAMRRMVGGLRNDSPTAPATTWDDVDQLIANANSQDHRVRAAIQTDARTTSRSLVPSVHRIIAESLTNARRHGHQVTCVDIAVLRRGDRVVVTVQDDGLPTAPAGHGTFGIVGMRERAESLGGSLFAGPAPSGGWLVRAELPLEHPR